MSVNQLGFKWPKWLIKRIHNNREKWRQADRHSYGANAYFVTSEKTDLISIVFTSTEESGQFTNIRVEILAPEILSLFPDKPDKIQLTAFHPPQFSYGEYPIADGNGVAYKKTIPNKFDISILEKYL